MKLIKINTDHYVVVDETIDINENDYTLKDGEIRQVSYLMQDNGDVITHSTQPLEPVVIDITPVGTPIIDYEYDKVKQLSLQEVKELIGEVDVEKKASEYAINDFDDYAFCGYISGYNQALEDNKEKKYTEEDVINLFKEFGIENRNVPDDESSWIELKSEHIDEWIHNKLIQSLQPKTSWEVEIIDGKLKLK